MGDYDAHLQTLGWGPVFTSTDYIQRVMKHVTKTYSVRSKRRAGPSTFNILIITKILAK